MNKNKSLTSLFVFSLAILLFSCKGDTGKTEPAKKIEVIGSAEMEFVPDEIYMTFTLKAYLAAGNVKVSLETVKNEFLALCKASGVADSNISISGYAGYGRWDYYYYRARKSQPDFTGTISYVVKVNSPALLDKLIDGLNEKAVENFNITKTTHSKIEQFRQEVKSKAMLASKTKATYLAKSIDEEIGETLLIREIDNSWDGFSSNSNMASNSLLEYKSAAESYEPVAASPGFEKMKLRYVMQVEYRLK